MLVDQRHEVMQTPQHLSLSPTDGQRVDADEEARDAGVIGSLPEALTQCRHAGTRGEPGLLLLWNSACSMP